MPTPFYDPKIEGPYTAHFRAEILTRNEEGELSVPRDLWRDMKLEGDIMAALARERHGKGEKDSLSVKLVPILRVAFQKGVACHDLEHGRLRNMPRRRISEWVETQSKDLLQRTRDARRQKVFAVFASQVTKAQVTTFRTGWAWASGQVSIEDALRGIHEECCRQVPPANIIDLAARIAHDARHGHQANFAIAAE